MVSVQTIDIGKMEKHRIDNIYQYQKKEITKLLIELEYHLLQLNLTHEHIKDCLGELEDKLRQDLVSQLRNLSLIKWEPNDES